MRHAIAAPAPAPTPLVSPATATTYLEEVHIETGSSDDGLGLAFDASNFIVAMRPSGAAAKSQELLQVGDQVVSVQGVGCSARKGRSAYDILRTLPRNGSYVFVVRRDKDKIQDARDQEDELLVDEPEEGLEEGREGQHSRGEAPPALYVQDSGASSASMTDLGAAALGGLEGSVQELIERGADPNDRGQDVRVPPLCHAAASGALGTVALLLDKKADPSISNGFGSTALHFAAANGHETVVQHLIKHGAKPSAKNQLGDTALSTAALHNQGAVVDVLINLGGSVGCKRKGGWTPLHLAAGRGHTSVCDLLCARGAHLEARGDDDVRPLMHASAAGHLCTVNLLLEHSADVFAASRHGRTALHFAAAAGQQSCCELLFERGGLKLAGMTDATDASPADYARLSGHERLAESISNGVIGSSTSRSPSTQTAIPSGLLSPQSFASMTAMTPFSARRARARAATSSSGTTRI